LFDAVSPTADSAKTWLDTYRVAHPEKGENEGTFSSFKVGTQQGPRIDWIGCTQHWDILNADIDRTARDGRTPSDHFPITAELQFKR
jgi:exonuclease III